MKKLIMLSLLAVPFFAGELFAEDAAATDKTAPAKPRLTKAEREQNIMRKLGGFIIQPSTGVVAVVNAQTSVDVGSLKSHLAEFSDQIKIEIGFKETDSFSIASAQALRTKLGCDVAIFVVDDPALPMSLCAPEARWALVNVAPLKADSPDAEKLAKRINKVFARSLVGVNAGAMTKFQSGILKPVTSPADLDHIVYKGLPVDALIGVSNYLQSMGISHRRRVTYKRACEEGWAPSPTNEWQQAIMERVKAQQSEKPSKAVKIKYDPATGK